MRDPSWIEHPTQCSVFAGDFCDVNSLIQIFRKNVSNSLITEAKEAGFSDRQIGNAIGVTEKVVRQKRVEANIKPWVKQVSGINFIMMSNEKTFVNRGLQVTIAI